MVPKCFPTREKSSTIVTYELAHFPMLTDFVSKPVMSSAESLGAAQRARKWYAGFGTVRVHVDFESILGSEATCALGV